MLFLSLTLNILFYLFSIHTSLWPSYTILPKRQISASRLLIFHHLKMLCIVRGVHLISTLNPILILIPQATQPPLGNHLCDSILLFSISIIIGLSLWLTILTMILFTIVLIWWIYWLLFLLLYAALRVSFLACIPLLPGVGV